VSANVPDRLLKHYVDNFRPLPWRAAPGTPPPDPYRTWLSEVMLQQTTVAAVIPRFNRFVARWPTVAALAAAPDDAILSECAGLGYYARARNLIACAREVARRGAFPSTAAELRRLPGIGDYSAAAIAAIAFGERCAVVDTNVTRVIARLHGLARPERAEIRRLTLALTPADRPGDFAQAMMDLGATICRPAAPACDDCPLAGACAAYALGDPARLPERQVKRPRPQRFGITYWIERDGCVWLTRRPNRGLLGGMAALPTTEWLAERPGRGPSTLGVVRHGFTHFTLELAIDRADEPIGAGWWQRIDRLAEAGLPTLFRRAAELALREPATSAAAA
jgi:A/G-specific adenine glycosylase